MHIGRALAKLNPKNVRFDVGIGGIPDITPQDIAAALAFVPAGLGRELICRVWWPDGAALTANELDFMLIQLQFGEWRERMDALVTAQLRLATAANDAQRRKAKQGIADAQARMWPRIDDTFNLVRKAVLAELCDPRICPDCKGRGFLIKRELASDCERCSGTGRAHRGPVWRADVLGMKHTSYLQRWVEPYEWLLAKCSDALAQATREFNHVLNP